jgi:hypothetical protein
MKIEQVSTELIDRIRKHINRTDKLTELLKFHKKWLQLTSSLDVQEDSSWAINYYCKAEFPTETGGKYLFIYGFLQALFLQQDAINGISLALFSKAIDFKVDFPDAYAVRELRNDVSGHPTNRNDGKVYVYLVQISLQKTEFEYLRQTPDIKRDDEFIKVDVAKAISDTSRCINDVLSQAVNDLDVEFREYLDAHKERKMKEIFNQLGYACEKVLSNGYLKSAGYASSKRMVKECEDELVRRYGSVEAKDSFSYTLEKVHIAYDLIDKALDDIPDEARDKIKKCLQEYLFDRLQELADMSAEVDEYFEKA